MLVQLATLIQMTIEPGSWHDEEDGGSIGLVQLAGRWLLVVRQDYRTHRKIMRLLEELRKVTASPPATTVDPFGSPASMPPAPADPFGSPAPAEKASDDPFG